MNDKILEIKTRIKGLPLKSEVSNWKRIQSFGIGGLTEIGFSENSDYLLVISHQGRGIFNCVTGEKVARDSDTENHQSWSETVKLIGNGFDILEGQKIRLAGLYGGALPRFTQDNWSLEKFTLDFPNDTIILCPPFKTAEIENFSDRCAKISEDFDVRAFGFSDTGKSFVFAWSHTLEIFSR